MQERYENKRENLWKEFDAGVKGKHYSFFIPRNNSETPVSSKVFTPKEVNYEILISLPEVETLLKKKMQYKRNWKPYEIYDFSALVHYIEQARKENCKKVLISKKEFAIISKNKK